jgi:hypothetical protein
MAATFLESGEGEPQTKERKIALQVHSIINPLEEMNLAQRKDILVSR